MVTKKENNICTCIGCNAPAFVQIDGRWRCSSHTPKNAKGRYRK